MAEIDATLLTILTGICLVLLIVVLALMFGISSRLGRLESRIGQKPADPADGKPTAAESSAGGAFDQFLNEDPARRELSKAEQFGAFRKWRQQKGMNWSKS